ncbi:MAG: hypothetical protein ABIJ09_26260 [Pseudomonadota bacterium]
MSDYRGAGQAHSARQMLSRHSTRLACAVAAAITGLVLLVPMALRGPLFGLDLTLNDLGTFCAVKHALHDGTGLWLSSWIGNGGLLALRPNAQLFYPPRWLFLALPVDWGNALHQAAHLVAGAATATWLARSHGARPVLATSAGIAFALAGPALDLVRHGQYVIAAAWLPLVWVAGRTVLRAGPKKGGATALVSLGLAALLLGGEPQAFALACAVLALEGALRLWRQRHAPVAILRRGVRLVMAILSAIAIGAIVLLPMSAELGLSRRGQPLALDKILQWSFDASLWPAALVPGSLFRDGVWALVRDDHVDTLWNPSPYVGGLFLLLAVLGCTLRRARPAAIIAVAASIASLGSATPLWPAAIRFIPGLDWFRFPAKYLVIASLAGMVCAVLALQRARRDRAWMRRLALGATVIAVVYLATSAVVGLHARELDELAVWASVRSYQVRPGFAGELCFDLVRAAAPLLCVLVLWRWRSPRAVMTVALCWMLDVGGAALLSLRAGPTLSDLRSPLSGHPAMVICHNSDLYGAELVIPESEPGWGQAAFQRLYALPELQACDRIAAAVPYSPLTSRVAHALYFAPVVLAGASARALGCTHVLSASPLDDVDLAPEPWSALRASVPEAGPQLYSVVDPLAEVAQVVRPALVAEADAITRIPQTHTAAAALALIDDPLARLPASTRSLPASGPIEAMDVQWISATQATLRLRGTGPVVVALHRCFLVGWSAEQASHPVPVVRAAGNQLAVIVDDVDAGDVHLQYRPPHLWTGAGLSFAGVFGLLLLVFVPGAQGRRPRREDARMAAARGSP